MFPIVTVYYQWYLVNDLNAKWSFGIFIKLIYAMSSALADNATGKKKVMVPYRNSVLTTLLQSALGGNSRTLMVRIPALLSLHQPYVNIPLCSLSLLNLLYISSVI